MVRQLLFSLGTIIICRVRDNKKANYTLISYNKLRNNSREIEFQLVQEEIQQIDELVKKGEYSLNWNSEGIFKYININVYKIILSNQYG